MEKDKIKITKSRVNLQSLYPKPQTYEEKLADRKRLDLRREANLPKHVGLMSAVQLSAVFVYTLWLTVTVPSLIYAGIFGVCMCFLLFIVWSGFVFLITKNIADKLRNRGFNPLPFLIAYGICAMPLVAIGVKTMGNPFVFSGLTVLNFLIVWLFASVSRSQKPASIKIATFCTIWAITIVLYALFTQYG